MKRKKIIGVTAIASVSLILGMGSVFADETMESSSNRMETREMRKTEMKEMRSEKKEYIEEKRSEMKDARNQYKAEHKGELKEEFSDLDEETQSDVKALMSTHREELKVLQEKFREAKGDEEAREVLKMEIKAVMEEHKGEVLDIVGQDSEFALQLESRLTAHKEMLEERSEAREEIKEKRSEFREKKSEVIMKYKGAFIDVLGNRLDKVPTEKLEKISEALNAMYDKAEANEKISDTNKETLLAKITALLDMVDEILEESELEFDDVLEVID